MGEKAEFVITEDDKAESEEEEEEEVESMIAEEKAEPAIAKKKETVGNNPLFVVKEGSDDVWADMKLLAKSLPATNSQGSILQLKALSTLKCTIPETKVSKSES